MQGNLGKLLPRPSTATRVEESELQALATHYTADTVRLHSLQTSLFDNPVAVALSLLLRLARVTFELYSFSTLVCCSQHGVA
eukprot:6197900-Pleurochrysis_carterae.AAC.2